jgi:hypothetical protein
MKKSFITVCISLLSFTGFSQDILDKWSCTIDSGKKDPVVFNFTFAKSDEKYVTTTSSKGIRTP